MTPVAPPADANALCTRCGGPAYHGAISATCLRATGCGPAPLPEPTLSLVVRGGENIWRASGGDRAAEHPLRDGAIRLWRATEPMEIVADAPWPTSTPWAITFEAVPTLTRPLASPVIGYAVADSVPHPTVPGARLVTVRLA